MIDSSLCQELFSICVHGIASSRGEILFPDTKVTLETVVSVCMSCFIKHYETSIFQAFSFATSKRHERVSNAASSYKIAISKIIVTKIPSLCYCHSEPLER